LASVLVLALIAVVVGIQMDQILLRKRAEQLLADIKLLQVRRTTFTEAEQLLHRWKSVTKRDGDCSRKCGLDILLQDFAYEHGSFLGSRMLSAYMRLGGHPARVRVGIGLRDGIVWSESVGVYVEVAPYHDDTGTFSQYSLLGGASFGSDPPTKNRNDLHPAYAFEGLGGGCEVCQRISVLFTPDASPSDINRLMQFDLGCLTRWRHPCRRQGDIMPAAWRQYLDEEVAGRPLRAE
jgi:hypothetical protein